MKGGTWDHHWGYQIGTNTLYEGEKAEFFNILATELYNLARNRIPCQLKKNGINEHSTMHSTFVLGNMYDLKEKNFAFEFYQ